MSEYIKLLYPNDTTVTIEGDQEIITQILRHLDNKMIGFVVKEGIDAIEEGWSVESLRKVLEHDL